MIIEAEHSGQRHHHRHQKPTHGAAVCRSSELSLEPRNAPWYATGEIGATLQLRSDGSHLIDCENCETKKVAVGNIDRRIPFHRTLTGEQRARLLQIVDRCPVKPTMERGMTFSPILTERQP